jgi:hypothetical protein
MRGLLAMAAWGLGIALAVRADNRRGRARRRPPKPRRDAYVWRGTFQFIERTETLTPQPARRVAAGPGPR